MRNGDPPWRPIQKKPEPSGAAMPKDIESLDEKTAETAMPSKTAGRKARQKVNVHPLLYSASFVGAPKKEGFILTTATQRANSEDGCAVTVMGDWDW